jgi:hypothetical protein
MAQIATGAIGAFIGYALTGFTNPQGAYWGWTIGVAVGTVLFPPDGIDSIGPRLNDKGVQTSTYGAPIAIVWGTMRTAGNVIWATDIIEKTVTEKVGGKGGSDSTETTYEYFGNMAVGICEGEAELLRIWANGKLIYDATTIPDPLDPLTDGLRFWGLISGQSELPFTRFFNWYSGTETQLPDPYIESFEGVGEVPGNRGLCYIVFKELPLEDYGNGIPNLTFEVTRSASIQNASDSSAAPALYREEHTYPLWDRGVVVRGKSGAGATDPITQLSYWDLPTMTSTEVDPVDTTDLDITTFRSQCGMLTNGNLVYEVQDGTTMNWHYIEINPDTMAEVSSLRTASTTTHAISHKSNSNHVGFRVGADYYTYYTSNAGTEGQIYKSGTGNVGVDQDMGGADRPLIAIPGWRHADGGFYRVYRESTTNVEVTKFLLTKDEVTAGTYLLEQTFIIDIANTDVDATWATFSDELKVFYDQVDNTLILLLAKADLSELRFVKVDPEDRIILWVSEMVPVANYHTLSLAALSSQSVLQHNRLEWVDSGETGRLLDTTDGTIEVVNTGYTTEDGSEVAAYHSGWRASVEMDEIFYFGRKLGLPTTVKEIADDIIDRVGLQPADVNTTALTTLALDGYIMSRNMQGKAALEPMLNLFLVDLIEVDDVLEFIARGGASVVTIDEQDFVVPRNEKETFVEIRKAETELPSEIAISYVDQANDYNETLLPNSEVQSVNKANLQVPAAVNPDFMKAQVSKLLMASWEERITRNFTLSTAYLKYVPTDIITLTLDDGRTVRNRFMSGTIGNNLTYGVNTSQEDSSQYSASATADTGEGVVGQTVPAASELQLLAVRSPLLRDIDDNARIVTSYYYYIVPKGIGGLSLGLLYDSSDGNIYTRVGASSIEPTWGHATNAIGVVPDDAVWVQDNTNTLNVRLRNEGTTLSSVTFDQMITGTTNAFALIHSNGDVELMKFQTVVAEGDGTFTLSGLLRGRRGTEGFMAGHGTGDVFIMLGLGGNIGNDDIANIGNDRFFKTLNNGDSLDDVDPTVESNPGYDLKPYAPVWVESDGALWGTDITFDWTRRTRVGGALKDSTGSVPLAEDTEEYEVEIYDGATLERTFTGLTTPTVTYTSAQQTADAWSGTPTEVSVIVYQISAQVGRGFPSVKTVIPV